MSEPTWEVQQEGEWYRVAARATCPLCGEMLQHEELRRVAAGPPETPPLQIAVSGAAIVELTAAGWLLPVIVHRCAGGSPSS